MAVIVLLNNFLHDFSAAGWIFGSLILWVILRKSGGNATGDSDDTVMAVLKMDMLLMRLSLAGIIVFGAFRALAYRTYEWNAAAGEGQITLLVVKHIILTVVFVIGLVLYRRAGKMTVKISDETKK